MKTYNVVMVATAEWEVEVDALSEEHAEEVAQAEAQDRDLAALLAVSGFVSTTLPEAVEAWEI